MRAFFALMMAACAATAAPAAAETFPAGPVTLVVPWPAGGTTDVAMRALAAATARHLGQPIVIENRPGAGGTLAPMHMAETAGPDGYTIAQIPFSVLRAGASERMKFDPATDLTYIIGLTGYTFGIVVRSDASWATFEDLLADAKRRPGKITFGTPGSGTTPHVTMERIAASQAIDWVHVPFKGSAETTNALLGGHVDAVADGTSWGAAGGFRRFPPPGDLGKAAHRKVAERPDAAGNRHRHRCQRAIWPCRPEGHGPGGRRFAA